MKLNIFITSLSLLLAGNTIGGTATVIPSADTMLYRDSTIRLYFVCESTHSLSGIFKNGDKISVVDTLGRKAYGILKVLNGKKIEISNRKALKDTFDLGAIEKVRRISAARTALAATALTIGTIGIGTGIGLVAYAPYGGSAEGLYILGGLLLDIIFIPIEVGGALLSKGRRYTGDNCKFRIIQTKGFELKRKHLKDGI